MTVPTSDPTAAAAGPVPAARPAPVVDSPGSATPGPAPAGEADVGVGVGLPDTDLTLPPGDDAVLTTDDGPPGRHDRRHWVDRRVTITYTAD